jgi:ATP-dependent Zn protease
MREGRKVVENNDFEAVKEKVLLGKRKILSFTEEERKIQAVYQSAKAVIATWLDVEFDKIGIVTTRLLFQEHEILSRSKLINRIMVYLAGSIAMKQHYNEQFTNASEDIRQAKELVNKVIYTYAMSEDFIVTPLQEEELLRDTVSEVTALLNRLDKALNEVSMYLLHHENITQEKCKEILREIF